MKSTGRYKNYIGWLALLVFLFTGFANFEGWVLCFEADGRVSLESAFGNVCSDPMQGGLHKQNFSDQQSLQASHCARCVDIPLSIDNIKQNVQSLEPFQSLLDMPVMAQMFINSPHYLLIAVLNQLPQPPPTHPVLHRYLSTIVLLI